MDERVEALQKFVDRLLLRSSINADEQRALLDLPGTFRDVVAHRDLVRPGETVRFACLVATGTAARFDQLANGRRQITAVHIPGDMCDLHSVPTPTAGWGIQALSDCRFLLVPHDDLRRLAIEVPALTVAFWRDTVADASILGKWVSALGRRSAEPRLAHLLCELGYRRELAHEGKRDDFRLGVTQSQLADILGITPVHANRMLQSLRARGIVGVENQWCHVFKPDALRQIAEFDETYLLLHEPDIDEWRPAGKAAGAQASAGR